MRARISYPCLLPSACVLPRDCSTLAGAVDGKLGICLLSLLCVCVLCLCGLGPSRRPRTRLAKKHRDSTSDAPVLAGRDRVAAAPMCGIWACCANGQDWLVRRGATSTPDRDMRLQPAPRPSQATHYLSRPIRANAWASAISES